jgi:hypothetical protein
MKSVMMHPLENKSDSFPAVASAWMTAIVLAVGLWTLLHTFAPPVGWSEGLDAPVRVNIGFFGTMWHGVWANAPAVSSIGSIAEFASYIVTRPVASLAADGVLTQTLILLAVAMIAGRKSYKIIYQAVYRGLPRTRNVQTCIGSEPRHGGYGISHIEETWRDRLMAAGRGIYLAPGVRMPRDVEPEHVAVLGTTGAGKSTIVEGLLQQAIRRGDRCLIVDVKGHAKRRFNVPGAGELALGSKDGFIWAIGRDIRNRQDAIELAAVLIPASKDPIWSDGARLYLVGLIVALQRQLGLKWGWKDLKGALAKSFEEQEALIRDSMPDVVHLLQSKDGDPTATVMSILVTVVANVGSFAWSLAAREQARGPKISLREWAAGKSRRRVVFLRLEFDRENQSAAFLKLCLRCVQATLLGSQVDDETDQAIWLGLDELPRFCDDTTVERLVALGRSRGVRIVAALQVPAQLRRTLSADATNSLLGNFGLQIVSRVAPGPSRGEIARDWFGTRTVTWDPALTGGDATKDRPSKEIPVLSESELTGTLGKFYSATGRPFIRAAITGFEHVPILEWPVGWAKTL